MIRMVMLGRLGNNLFQYAFGRMLAEKHGVPLVMDASWFNNRTWPYVEPLRRFPNLQARVVRPFSAGSRLLLKLTRKHHWEYRGVPIIREKQNDQSFDASLLNAPSDCAVFGYFQTPRYFEDISGKLRKELSLTGMGLETGSDRLADRLRDPASVAVHVRRTDYLRNVSLVSLDTGYYRAAMKRIRENVSGARFHIFSDDPEWCVANLRGDDISVRMKSDPFSPLADLHLMSLASHHIIANSSYSWWAAWLGKKEGQRVLVPDRWFQSGIRAPAGEKLARGWDPMPTR